MRSLFVSLALALTIVTCLSLPVVAEDNAAKLPNGVEEFLKNYYAVISKEDVDGYKKLIHPNGFSSVPVAATIEGWKKYDRRPSVTKIELLHSDPEMVILKVHTRTRFSEYPLDTIDTSLVVLRKWTDSWRLWHDSLLDTRKDG